MNVPLEELIERQPEILAARASAAGLSGLRARSAPDRLTLEGTLFVRLLRREMAGDQRVLGEARVETRLGAFAGAGPEEVRAIFALWREVIASASVTKASTQAAALGAVDRLATLVAEEAERWSHERIDVVTVGASAGGIQALQGLLSRLDEELPITLIIVLHVSAHSPSLLASVLSRSTRVVLATAEENAPLQLGWAYVAPPNRHLLVEGDRLHLDISPPLHYARPAANLLFESASRNFGARMASVVLSGTGVDGAAGTTAVHRAGGVTFVQSPEDAEFRGMPEMAISTGEVDHTMSLDAIASALRRLAVEGRGALANLPRKR